MNHRLKTLLCLLLTLTFAPLLAPGQAEEARLSIIATVFPAYDFARALAGDTAQVSLLLPPGGESHSYEPTPQDIVNIQGADLFLYVGGESDHWVESILASMGEDAPRTFRLMDCVTVLAEETSASMEHEHDEDHEHEEGHEHAEAEAMD